MNDEDTQPSNPKVGPPESDDHPAVRAAERFAHLVGVLLEPIKQEIAKLTAAVDRLNADVTIKNATLHETQDQISTLQRQVRRIEKNLEIADTLPPETAA